jgi:SNF2 family DNA or RNA helicase
MTDEFPFKTKPFQHQADSFQETRDTPAYGIFWEQGTGKSKLTIDTAAWMFFQGRINTLLVIAPNGVHRNWIVNEVPAHLPESVPLTSFLWLTQKSANKGFKAEAAAALASEGFLVVAMSYDSVMTKAGDAYLVKLLAERRCLMTLDESARIKNPKAKRSIRILARGKRAAFRRILTGTPVANSPFDVFTQLSFLNPTVWHSIGCRSFAAFKNCFGVWEDALDPRSGRAYRNLVRYRNLERLHTIVDSLGTRVTKAEVLDLPPKLYTKRYFDLSPNQQRAYLQMSETWEVKASLGGEVTAMLAIVQLLRFQQIVSGFVVDEDDYLFDLDETCPRVTAVRDVVADTTGQLIVWAKFRHDIDNIMLALKADKVSAVRYDGSTSADDRATAIDEFQAGNIRVFVANPAAAGEGLTLHAATTVVYYNNSFKLTDRLQSEDRAHRIGQEHPVTYIDIVAAGTVDEKIADALRNKLDVASIITGDRLKEWI